MILINLRSINKFIFSSIIAKLELKLESSVLYIKLNGGEYVNSTGC